MIDFCGTVYVRTENNKKEVVKQQEKKNFVINIYRWLTAEENVCNAFVAEYLNTMTTTCWESVALY